jgi:hypothetical protein
MATYMKPPPDAADEYFGLAARAIMEFDFQ